MQKRLARLIVGSPSSARQADARGDLEQSRQDEYRGAIGFTGYAPLTAFVDYGVPVISP